MYIQAVYVNPFDSNNRIWIKNTYLNQFILDFNAKSNLELRNGAVP